MITAGGEAVRPPAGRPPPEGECHLWIARVDAGESRWRDVLDDGDLAVLRARRVFADPPTAMVSRAVQRIVAGHYAGVDPRQVVIRRTCRECGSSAHGRPAAVGAGLLDYSVSHHDGWVLLAAVGAGLVGVDLEGAGAPDGPDVDDLAATVLGPREVAVYRSLPRPARVSWLHQAWARKEAVVKLTGHGLVLDPAVVDVSGPVAVVRSACGPLTPGLPSEPVLLRDLSVPPGYRAALATTRPVPVLQSYRVAAPHPH